MPIRSQLVAYIGFPMLAICILPGEGQPSFKDVDGSNVVSKRTHQYVLQKLNTVCIRSIFQDFTVLIAQRLIRIGITNASKTSNIAGQSKSPNPFSESFLIRSIMPFNSRVVRSPVRQIVLSR